MVLASSTGGQAEMIGAEDQTKAGARAGFVFDWERPGDFDEKLRHVLGLSADARHAIGDAAVEAGIDLIQHPEVLAGREYSDELITQIRERGVICSMLANTLTGEAWQKHLSDVEAAERRLSSAGDSAEWGRLRRGVEREEVGPGRSCVARERRTVRVLPRRQHGCDGAR